MIVYKATNQDMSCHKGQGRFQYELGVPAVAENSKCGYTGLHACEYVLDCVTYYSFGGGNRFFEAEAEGNIAEDGTNTRISCTKLTLTRELKPRDMAGAAMLYMIKHPKREGWEVKRAMVEVCKDKAIGTARDSIAIARGERPVVKGVAGAHLGLIVETEEGIVDAKLFTVEGKYKPNTWYTLINREPMEV